MTQSHLSVLQGGAADAAPDGATQLHLPGPVQVHIHLGQASAAQVQPAPALSLRRPFVFALVSLALFGSGYVAALRTSPAAPVDATNALASGPALPLSPFPGATAELPPVLQQQLARPPVVTPPPGATPAGPAGSPPAAPGRNPFGLGN